MTQFTVVCANGEEVAEFRVDALDAAGAAEAATSRGLIALSVHARFGFMSFLRIPGPKFPTLWFAQELASLLKAGLSLVEALAALEGKDSSAAERRIVSGLLVSLREGRSLTWSLSRSPGSFPAMLVSLVEASERTGNLREALDRYVAYRTQLDDLRNRLVTALTYPTILLVAGTCVIAFLMLYVVPRFSRIYAELKSSLPFMSRILLESGQFIDRNWLATAACGLAGLAVIGAVLASTSTREALLATLAGAPAVAGRLRSYRLSRLYRTLGVLLKGGIPILTSLAMARSTLPAPQRAALDRAALHLREGASIVASFERESLTTPVSARLMLVGERGGDMAEMLEQAARFHDEQLSREIARFVRGFEPLVMALMGLVIGMIVVLMYLPIFELAGSLQ